MPGRTHTTWSRRRLAALAVACGALVVAFAGAPPAHALSAGSRDAAVATAVDHVRASLHLEVDTEQVYAFPSRRDPAWILVDGFDVRDRPWAVFLRLRGDRWRVRAASSLPRAGPADVPCDIRWPFSEPGC